MTDPSKSLQKAKRELDEHQDQMSLFAKGFTPVMRLLMVYLILALVGLLPGFPGIQWAALVWIALRLGVPMVHPEMKEDMELQKKVFRLESAEKE